jgi:anaerobic selenocysteine-containing dehydrogenase
MALATGVNETSMSERAVVNGTCHHDCPDSCGWQVTVSDGVAVKLRGNKDHPYSQGELCPKVNRFLDRVYSPDRILTPLRRTGPKGSGAFEPISWDDALTVVADNLHRVIDTDGAEAVYPYSSAGNQSLLSMMAFDRFFHHIGASRVVRALCGPTVGAGITMTNGTGKTLEPMELRHSKLIILWATNTRLTNRHLWPTIEAARANGARVVAIDALRTITADAADEFIQPLPGTDVALMLGIMHILIRDGLTDDEWIREHADGFAELAAHVAEWTPERAAATCGLDVDVIERLGHDYGTIRPAAIRTLIGAEHHTNGAMFFRTLAVLPALVGAWRDAGGGLSRSTGVYQGDGVVDEEAVGRPDLLAGREPRWLNMSRLGDELTDESLDPPVKALVVWAANPAVTVPNAEAIRRGLARDDLFTVVHEQFLTDTARYADIVFPATTQIEQSDVVQAWGHLWLGWNEAAIEPIGESCRNTELMRRLAGAMGYTEPALFEDDETILVQALGSKEVLAELKSAGWVKVPYPEDGRPFGDGVFPTATGRVQLVNEGLASMGQPVLPTFVPPIESPNGDRELAARYPLQLMTPKHHSRFLNSSYSPLPKHGPAEGAPFVEIDASDAAARGLADGDLAEVLNDRSSVVLPVRVGERVRAGVVAIPFGWWMSQHPDGRAANALTNDTLTDWGGGVAYSDTLVEVRKA